MTHQTTRIGVLRGTRLISVPPARLQAGWRRRLKADGGRLLTETARAVIEGFLFARFS